MMQILGERGFPFPNSAIAGALFRLGWEFVAPGIYSRNGDTIDITPYQDSWFVTLRAARMRHDV